MSSVDVARNGAAVRNSNQAKQTITFAFLIACSFVVFHQSLGATANLALSSHYHTHILFIPIISLCLLLWERQAIFYNTEFEPRVGIPLLSLGIILYYASSATEFSLPLAVSAIIFTWIAAFLLCFGKRSWLAARFSLCFLLLMIPLPIEFLDRASTILQYGSAEVTAMLFNLFGIPAFRNELTFTLPGVIIEIAKECSGIRSSIALVITSILAGHIFLQSGWKRLSLVLLTIPITIFKNAIRIVVLAGLGVYVDQDFLHGDLHHSGGVLFSLVALAIFLPLLGVLYRLEARTIQAP